MKISINNAPSASDCRERWRLADVEHVRPVGIEPLFAAAAELVKPDRGERTDQRKPGGQSG